MNILGIDIGTTTVTALVFDTQAGKIAIQNNNPYNTLMAANILGFERVSKAMIAQGII